MSSTREFTLIVPGAEPRDHAYDLWGYISGHVGRSGETDTEVFGEDYVPVIHRLGQEFDRLRGIDDALTSYAVAAFWEIPPGTDPLDLTTWDANVVVYLHEGDGVWSDADFALRAVLEHDQTVQHLHYGVNEAGVWTFTDLAAKPTQVAATANDYQQRIAEALAYIGPTTELEYADVDVAEVKRILEGR